MGKALKGRRDEVVLATKFHGARSDDDPNHRRQLAPLDHPRGGGQPAPAADRLDRPLPGAPAGAGHRHRRDAGRAVRPGAARARSATSARPPSSRRRSWRRSGWPSERHRERPVTEQPPYSHPGARCGARSAARWLSGTGWACCPWSPLAGGWLSGRYRRGRRRPASSRAAARQPARHDPSLAGERPPSSRRCFELTELADQAGLSLIHLALAFVLEHPAMTSAIIGPRTLEQLESQLGADKVDAVPRTCWTGSTRSSPPGTR